GDASLKEEVRITVIATGFDRLPAEAADGYAKRVAVGAPPRVVQAQQIALPYSVERESTKDYPPPVTVGNPAFRSERLPGGDVGGAKPPPRRLSSGRVVIGSA